MLWTKGWLETRWRLCLMGALALLLLGMAEQGGGLGSAEHARNLMMAQCFLAIMTAINLAGAGIRTQSAFRAKAGLHGSTQYTLSLPVSRFRLLAVRAMVGLAETTGIVTFMTLSFWTLFPLVRGTSTPSDLLKLLLAGPVCVLCFYFLSVTIATVLDEMWQVYGSLVVAGLIWWASSALPPYANVFRFSTDASPLLVHHLPWPAMGISVAASALLFLTAVLIVNKHEY
jgi:hypothetical protein